ncbi:MAG: glycosyltransferase [Caulobacterales bacterium]|nr:glycosyltransferase [Caulobacterales bacterium]
MLDKTQATDAPYEFGYRKLGPVVADYCARLLAHALSFEREQDGKVLFVARAGVRIRTALEAFAATAEIDLPTRADYLWASRLMVAKGVWRRSRARALQVLGKEFAYAPLKDFVAAMFRHEGLPRDLDLNDPALAQRASNLEAFFASGGPAARAVDQHLVEQSELFDAYIAKLLGDHELALLIDTGWQGTAQSMLDEAFPDVTWWGAYFGRFSTDATDKRGWSRMIGVVTEHGQFDPAWPESCVVLHRHMIEHLFQPTGLSIERLAPGADGVISSPEAASVLLDKVDRENSPMFAGVLDYLAKLPDGVGPAALRARAHTEWRNIARAVVLPSKDDVEVFADITRSADFGRSIEVPLLLPTRNRHRDDSPEARVRDSLWHAGQLALEYPQEIAQPMQRKIAGIGRGDLSEKQKPARKAAREQAGARPKVAIITRTLDRQIFLKRALASVASQTFTDYVHVVVNDGGDNDAARETIEAASVDLDRLLLVDNVVNRGMEAASNIAISSCDSDFIVIHDDDDTWEPTFLEKTVSFLESSRGRHYDGVITRSTYVSESVTPTGIVTHGSGPYNGWVETVHLHEMAVQNFFPPIGFLFRRSRYDAIGGFDERYPVLGDWDFNLRFLSESNIAVLPESLANYHHRDRGDTAIFGNSVIADRHKHLEYSAVVRNNLVRYLSERGRQAEASMIGLGILLGEERDLGRRTVQKLDALVGGGAMPAAQHVGVVHHGSHNADAMWIATQRLAQIIARGDVVALAEVGLASDPRDIRQRVMRILARVVGLARPIFAATDADLSKTPQAIAKLVALHRDPYRAMPPPADFDEIRYLRDNPDVATAITRGELTSGFEHYFYNGRQEGRARPSR